VGLGVGALGSLGVWRTESSFLQLMHRQLGLYIHRNDMHHIDKKEMEYEWKCIWKRENRRNSKIQKFKNSKKKESCFGPCRCGQRDTQSGYI